MSRSAATCRRPTGYAHTARGAPLAVVRVVRPFSLTPRDRGRDPGPARASLSCFRRPRRRAPVSHRMSSKWPPRSHVAVIDGLEIRWDDRIRFYRLLLQPWRRWDIDNVDIYRVDIVIGLINCPFSFFIFRASILVSSTDTRWCYPSENATQPQMQFDSSSADSNWTRVWARV